MDGRCYSPGYRLIGMVTGLFSSQHIRTARVAVLSKLVETVGETCNIALPDGDAMVYLERVESKWPLRLQLPVGTRVPLHCTASGKLYLSQLEERHLRSYASSAVLTKYSPTTLTQPEALMDEVRAIRERGYSTDHSEFMDGMIAVLYLLWTKMDGWCRP